MDLGLREAISGFGQLLASEEFAALSESNGALSEANAALLEINRQYGDSLHHMEERLAELELSLEDVNYQKLTGESRREFSRAGLKRIDELAVIYWLKNPLIRQGVAVQTRYVFGQGVNIRARHPKVNEVIQAFLDDKDNKKVLTSHEARMVKETELQVHANHFFVFFVNKSTGTVKIRTIIPDEIDDIICDPEDAQSPWYYKRIWTQKALNTDTGATIDESKTAYYPDWRYKPDEKPGTIGGHPVMWDSPVYHVAVNKLSSMRFGVSEIYAACDWARAYKDFLTDWATIVRAYARFAWNLKTKGGAAAVQTAKTRLGTTMTSTDAVEKNPPPVQGGTFVRTEGVEMEPMRTAGATTSAEDGRRLLLMVCAALGVFEHYMGDPSTGNLATAKSMERPMELKFIDRQSLWRGVFLDILGFVLYWAVKATSGKLAGGSVTEDEDGNEVLTLPIDADNSDPEKAVEPMDDHIDVDFPPILEKDVLARVQAIVSATTMGGMGTPAGTLSLKYATQLLLQALGVPDTDEVMDELFPPDQDTDAEGDGEPTDQVAESIKSLAEAAMKLAERAA